MSEHTQTRQEQTRSRTWGRSTLAAVGAGTLLLTGCAAEGANATAESQVAPQTAGQVYDLAAQRAHDILQLTKDGKATLAIAPTELDFQHKALVITEQVGSALSGGATGAEGTYRLTAVGDQDMTEGTLDTASVLQLQVSDDRGGHEHPLYTQTLTRQPDGSTVVDTIYLQSEANGITERHVSTVETQGASLLSEAGDFAANGGQMAAAFDAMQQGADVNYIQTR